MALLIATVSPREIIAQAGRVWQETAGVAVVVCVSSACCRLLSAVGRPLESRTPAPLPEFVGLREDFEDTEIITFWRSFRRISNSKQPCHEKIGSFSYMYETVFPATSAIKTKAMN